MKKLLHVSAASVLCAIGALSAGHTQSVTCQNAQFDPAVLAKYPDLQKNCLDVVKRGNEDFAVVTARLEKVNPSGSVVVRSKLADGSYGERRTLQPPDNMKIIAGGKPADIHDLAVGQDVTAYVRVTAPAVMALIPVDPATPLHTTSLEEPERMAALPSTASMVPALGLVGSVFLLIGGLLTTIRRRH
jgi:LPXTG-motif cell wall-anchored protein